MRRSTVNSVLRTAVLLLLGVFLNTPSAAFSLTIKQVLEGLSSADPTERFNTALHTLGARRSDTAELLSRGLEHEMFRDKFAQSKEARAAVDFVLLKLKGENMPAMPPSTAAETDVVLISIDTLRADHLGCYGYERPSTPTMDALAASGARFSRASSSSSWTLPAHMSMFTSLYPSFHKLEKGGVLGSTRLDDSEVTLASRLKQAGYSNAGIVAHPFLSSEWGFDDGFDVYGRYSTRAETQTDRALVWLEWHQFHAARGLRKPQFFLFLHYIDPHEPYSAPSPYNEKYFPDYRGPLRPSDKLVTLFSNKPFESPDDMRYALALYDGEINYVDAQLGRLIQRLRELGREDSTLVILTSDHGEEFKDHGSMGHKRTLYDEQLNVPLIVSYPRAIAADQEISVPVSVLDIMPTILDLTGLKARAKAQGVSLRRYMKMKEAPAPGAPAAARHIFAELGPLAARWERADRRKIVRTDRYKLIYNYPSDGSITKELYRIDADQRERVNLYEEKKDTPEVRQLEEKLERFIREGLAYNPDFAAKNQIEIDTATRERLRALGYIE